MLSIKYPSAQRRASSKAMELEARLKIVRSIEEAFLAGEPELPGGVGGEFLLANSASFLPDVLEHHTVEASPAGGDMDEDEREGAAGSAAPGSGATSGGKSTFLDNSSVPTELNLIRIRLFAARRRGRRGADTQAHETTTSRLAGCL